MEIDLQRFEREARYRSRVFEDIVRGHAAAIIAYCTACLGVSHGEDVAQEVFVAAAERLLTFRPEEDPEPWLLGIARNKCRQFLRNRRRRADIAASAMDEIRNHAHRVPPAPPDHLMARQAREQRIRTELAAGLSQLKTDDQLIIRWRYLKGLSVAEIADLLDLRETTARKRLERAMQRLRERLTHDASR